MPRKHHKFEPQLHQGSQKLLDHIKDEQFYSTLSTITLQLAKDAGAEKSLIDQLSQCFNKAKGNISEDILPAKSQMSTQINKQNLNKDESYDSYQKSINIKQQINFLKKMEKQLIQSREKQAYVNSLKKYAKIKNSQLLPVLNINGSTKKDRFKNMMKRKSQGNVKTTQNYFGIGPLQILKNTYEQQNQCYRLMRNITELKTMFGHSMDGDRESNCPLYNVLFDQSENLIISGGQQGAIKIWSKQTGLLLSSLKGHTQYINKLQVTKCNKYLYSSAGDGIRFFEMDSMTTLGGWKTTESIIDITSIYDEEKKYSRFMFSDKKNLYLLQEPRMLIKKDEYLVPKQDFSIFKYSHKLNKQSYLLMSHMTEDQTNTLLGFQTGDILLFDYQDLFKIDPIKCQTEPLSKVFNLPVKYNLRVHCDQIKQLKWHKSGQYFVTGGKQGYCLLWEYKQSNSTEPIQMNERGNNSNINPLQKAPYTIKQIQVSKTLNRRKKRAFGCNFISFNCTYTHFISGFMELINQDDQDRGNGDIIIYSLQNKQVTFEWSKDMPIKISSISGLDAHPIYENIVLICQSTGRILIFDFLMKTILNVFQLRGYHLLHPQFCLNPGDSRWSKDGKYFVVSTQYGSISLFGYDIKHFYQLCHTQQFFEADFVPFQNNQHLRPIPIQGSQESMRIDMNLLHRGEVRNIRKEVHDKQLKSSFNKFWKQKYKSKHLKGIQHQNALLSVTKNSYQSRGELISAINQNKNSSAIKQILPHLSSQDKQNSQNVINQHQQQEKKQKQVLKALDSAKQGFSNQNYNEYLKSIKHNMKQAQNFNNFYHHNLQQIQTNKLSILYEERQKQSRVIKKVLEYKIKSLNNGYLPGYMINRSGSSELTNSNENTNNLSYLSDSGDKRDAYNQILDELDLRGHRGGRGGHSNQSLNTSGRRLLRQSQRALRQPNYREDFQYGVKDDQFNILNVDEPIDEENLDELDNDYGDSDSFPRQTCRQGMRSQRYLRRSSYRNNAQSRIQPSRSTRYNIRSRNNDQSNRRHYNLENEDDETHNLNRANNDGSYNYKRRNPAQDVEEMLNNEDYKDYDWQNARNHRNGKKRRKLNRMYESSSDNQSQDSLEDFIDDGRTRRQNNRTRNRYVPSTNSDKIDGRQAYYNRGRGGFRVDQHQVSSHQQKAKRTSYMQILASSQQENEQKRQASPDKNKIIQQQGQQYENQNEGHYSLRTRNRNSEMQRRSNDRQRRNLQDQKNNSLYSSSMKKDVKEQYGQCLRCCTYEATVQCFICEESVFCQECKDKRGKEQKIGKFQCFICIYLNQSAGSVILNQELLTEQYYRLNGSELTNVYVPQISDTVRFFFQGYEQFIGSNIRYLNRNIPTQVDDYRLLPHIYQDLYSDQLIRTPKCKIIDIKFYFPYRPLNEQYSISNNSNNRFRGSSSRGNSGRLSSDRNEKKHIQMLIQLEIIPQNKEKQKQLSRNDFWVFYVPSDNNQFLVKEEVFSYIQNNHVVQKIKNNQIIVATSQNHKEKQYYQVVNFGPYQGCFPQSIWKYVKVVKSDSKRLRNSQKPDELAINIWDSQTYIPNKLKSVDQQKQMCVQQQKNEQLQGSDDLQKQYQKKQNGLNNNQKYKGEKQKIRENERIQLIKKLNEILEDQENHLFKDFVDFSIYPQYRSIVQVGVCLDLILSRLENSYYRCWESLKFDLDLMVNNSIQFNGEQGSSNGITEKAVELRGLLLQVIGLNENSSQKEENINKEKQGKQKRILQSKEIRQEKSKRSSHNNNNSFSFSNNSLSNDYNNTFNSQQRRSTRRSNAIPKPNSNFNVTQGLIQNADQKAIVSSRGRLIKKKQINEEEIALDKYVLKDEEESEFEAEKIQEEDDDFEVDDANHKYREKIGHYSSGQDQEEDFNADSQGIKPRGNRNIERSNLRNRNSEKKVTTNYVESLPPSVGRSTRRRQRYLDSSHQSQQKSKPIIDDKSKPMNPSNSRHPVQDREYSSGNVYSTRRSTRYNNKKD